MVAYQGKLNFLSKSGAGWILIAAKVFKSNKMKWILEKIEYLKKINFCSLKSYFVILRP